jgi:hypothetical protein
MYVSIAFFRCTIIFIHIHQFCLSKIKIFNETLVYGLKEDVLIESLLKTGKNFATFIRITEMNIIAVPKIMSLVVVLAWSPS